ncbi:MAG: hypothetical protein GSR72_08065 [Desulfurococcales archaeon]|nr:hypothetical protein [Desulfurococcales archaeon]
MQPSQASRAAPFIFLALALTILLHMINIPRRLTRTEPIIILVTLVSLAFVLVATLRRKKNEYCIEITISRTAPYTLLYKDLAYLSRLMKSLSKEHKVVTLTAPCNGKAVFCTSFNELERLAEIIDKNTSTLLISHAKEKQALCINNDEQKS